MPNFLKKKRVSQFEQIKLPATGQNYRVGNGGHVISHVAGFISI